jgi:uncharacterized Zn finger protein
VDSYYDWRPYVSGGERRLRAALEVARRGKQGKTMAPVIIEGQAIAKTFWGKSWCENLEHYSDYANRLPRGRAYARNGSVIDLQIKPGLIQALVSGWDLYEVTLKVAPVGKKCWKSICEDCAGAIDSLVELLRGRFSKGVMERICRQNQGLFPSPAEIELSCSCPDGARMCKHVAAALYGVGARLDHQPELLFRLRDVDEKELLVKAGQVLPLANQSPAAAKVLSGEDLANIFGLDMAQSTRTDPAPAKKRAVAKTTKKKAAKKTAPAARRQARKSTGK